MAGGSGEVVVDADEEYLTRARRGLDCLTHVGSDDDEGEKNKEEPKAK
jgi:hypothetical protein